MADLMYLSTEQMFLDHGHVLYIGLIDVKGAIDESTGVALMVVNMLKLHILTHPMFKLYIYIYNFVNTDVSLVF